MFSLLTLMVLAYAVLVEPAQLVQPTQYQKKNIFILAGQSNMAGRGGVIHNKWDRIVPLQCQPNQSILRLSSRLTWDEAQEPLHGDIDVNKTCGIGPVMAFANAIRVKDSSIGVVGLVPCAVGGTRISQWEPATPLFKQLVRRAKAAVKEGGTIRAILWYQGESDTVSRVDAQTYKRHLEKFFYHVRVSLQSPTLPIIQVALASGEGPYKEIVKQAQVGVNLPNVKCVDAEGLPLGGDGLHLTTTAQVQLGEMLADSFLKTWRSPANHNASQRS